MNVHFQTYFLREALEVPLLQNRDPSFPSRNSSLQWARTLMEVMCVFIPHVLPKSHLSSYRNIQID